MLRSHRGELHVQEGPVRKRLKVNRSSTKEGDSRLAPISTSEATFHALSSLLSAVNSQSTILEGSLERIHVFGEFGPKGEALRAKEIRKPDEDLGALCFRSLISVR